MYRVKISNSKNDYIDIIDAPLSSNREMTNPYPLATQVSGLIDHIRSNHDWKTNYTCQLILIDDLGRENQTIWTEVNPTAQWIKKKLIRFAKNSL
jgi:hypothetical protein